MNRPQISESMNQVGIYGVGLLGGSLGMALKDIYPDINIVGIGRSEERLEEARRQGAIDSFTCDPANITPRLDTLFICTPVRRVTENLQQTLPSLKPDAIVTDVGSTKALLVRQCEEIAENRVRFIGSHPIAGSHKTGVKHAYKDLYRQRTCVVTETNRSEPEAVETVCSVWKAIGMNVVRMSPEMHDRLTARSSHLPHLVAAALCHVVRTMGENVKPVLGSGFRDTTRIAAGDPGMWLDISVENRKEILASLESMMGILRDLHNQLEKGEEESIVNFLKEAQIWKKNFS